MPFRSSRIQSRIMEADSRSSFSISFLNLPSPFHASHSNIYSPQTSPLSTQSHTATQTYPLTNDLPSSTSSWWPIRVRNRHHKLEEVDEGLLSQGFGDDVMENAVLERNQRKRMVWELLALAGLLAFLVGVAILCMKSGGGMKIADKILAKN
ncbi:hypothetical protein DL95DRAFT_178214 [Leptodontidium sp. 2 PMI_412]|nr:hypothetical protein DL95DRAFT_178214 [Leptodontidium sp. 2 PMI_412]